MGCNFHVSVSSNGSRRVQQTAKQILEMTVKTFQYPLTDRDGCNFQITCVSSKTRETVSVSSNGSRRVQHCRIRRKESKDKRVSVSSNGSRRVQRVCPGSYHAGGVVSVSSNGSRRVQRSLKESPTHSKKCFSIL